MAMDDFVEPEVAVAVAVTAAVCSPPVRRVLRRGIVYGLAGLLVAKDKLTTAAQTVKQAAQSAVASNGGEAQGTNSPAPATQGATAG